MRQQLPVVDSDPKLIKLMEITIKPSICRRNGIFVSRAGFALLYAGFEFDKSDRSRLKPARESIVGVIEVARAQHLYIHRLLYVYRIEIWVAKRAKPSEKSLSLD
jgi:hypothetical protein